jgi:hypothetical protein
LLRGGKEMSWLDELKSHLETYNLLNVDLEQETSTFFDENEREAFLRWKQELRDREAEIVKSNLKAKIIKNYEALGKRDIEYLTYRTTFIRQKNHFYIEEYMEERTAVFEDNRLIDDSSKTDEKTKFSQVEFPKLVRDQETEGFYRYSYNRLEAVRYAERWWNGHNPHYKLFDDDCTNFISQCMHAGGAPMRGYPNRSNGWWYQNNNWSYSWSVANALRWYLSGSKKGLRAKEVESADQLSLGDIICYDFDGDGRWQHTTIVVARDEQGMPLVNAHTTNSRMRYWAYKDSTAWTSDVKYKFFQIIDG